MEIRIAGALSPFSHAKKVQMLLPRTTLVVTLFATRLELKELEGKEESQVFSFSWRGPLEDFTVMRDEDHLVVFGRGPEGFIRYHLFADRGDVYLEMRKGEGFYCEDTQGNRSELRVKEKIVIAKSSSYSDAPLDQDRLSLGVHKAQEIEKIQERSELQELLPHWLAAGQFVPSCDLQVSHLEGNYRLLERCEELFAKRERKALEKELFSLYRSAFFGWFIPCVNDLCYQGIVSYSDKKLPALVLLARSCALVRRLFVDEIGEGRIELLSCLPPSVHAGRMIGIKTSQGQTIQFEWTKHFLRRVIVSSCQTASLTLLLPKGISSCRQKNKNGNLQKMQIGPQRQLVLSLETQEIVELDRFE